MSTKHARSLPAASPATVLRVFQKLAGSGPPPEFRRTVLKKSGEIGQVSQGITLVSFLELRDGKNGKLVDDVQKARRSPDALTDLILARFRKACNDGGWWQDGLADFGRTPLGDRELTDLLESLPPLKRLRGNSKTNMLGCLRMLHRVLLHRLDPQWIKDELLLHPTRSQPENRRRAGAADTPEPRTASPRAKTSAARAAVPSRAADQGDVYEYASRKGEVRAFGVVEPGKFWVRDDNGKPRCISVTFDPPLDTLGPRDLLAIAHDLKEQAEASLADPVSGEASP
jgi:hypothetical protein